MFFGFKINKLNRYKLMCINAIFTVPAIIKLGLITNKEKNVKIKNIFIKILVLSTVFIAFDASAIPAFARKNNMACSACHTAFPALSERGRQFKEAGYRFPGSSYGDTKLTENLQFEKLFPMSAALIARPYTNTKSGSTEIRAIHEGELYIGGEISQNLAGFLEMEAEGADGFGIVLSSAHVTYSKNKSMNVQIGYGPTMMADPYDTYADMRRLTATHYELFNQTFGQADNKEKLRHSRQQVSLYGRPSGNLFYNVGVGGLTGDMVGSDSSIVFGRIAYDVAPGMMLGALALNGSCKLSETNCSTATQARKFSRVSMDGQFDIGNLRLTGVFMQAKDDTNAGSEVSNKSYYLQGFYRFMENGRPTLVPLVRLENYETNNGQGKYSLLTLNLSYYFDENVKGFIEYRDTYETPATVAKDNATTVQVEVVF